MQIDDSPVPWGGGGAGGAASPKRNEAAVVLKKERRQPERGFEGEWVLIGDIEFYVPALGLQRMKQVQGVLEKARPVDGARFSSDQMDMLIDLNFVAVSRNYPSLTKEEFGDLLDLKNIMDVTTKVLGVSGMGAVQPGEARSP